MLYHSALSLLAIVLFVNTCAALECYVCNRQEGNVEKCLNTIKTCEHQEDVCLSEIEWGLKPYFELGDIKQYYVSKRCSTKKDCEKYRKSNMHLCTHLWYQDWKCSECCKGDRCNYYIISGSQSIRSVSSILFGSLISMLCFKYLL